MDIASVYLNLASLLGTEIEVEGYYAETLEAVFIYSIECEQSSVRIILPRYLALKNLVKSYRDQMQAKIFLKGTLRQIVRGDLFLHHITSVSYKTDVVAFNLTITYQDHEIMCYQCTDFVFNWMAYLQGQYLPIRDIMLASSILSEPALFEGYLIPYPSTPSCPDIHLMMGVENIVYSVFSLQKPRTRDFLSFSDVLQRIFETWQLWYKTHSEQRKVKTVDVGGYTNIWIPKHLSVSNYLDIYFGDRYRADGGSHSVGDIHFTAAGTVNLIDKTERKDKGFRSKVRLKFTAIDYISARRTVILSHSQDEWASMHLLSWK